MNSLYLLDTAHRWRLDLQRLISCIFPCKCSAKFVGGLALRRGSVLQVHWLQSLGTSRFTHFFVVSRRAHFRRLSRVFSDRFWGLFLGRRRLRVDAKFLHWFWNIFWRLVVRGGWRKNFWVLDHPSVLLVKRSKEGKLSFLRRLMRAYDLRLESVGLAKW